MYTVIVAGTDGSDTASRAVEQAATIARTAGARLHVVTAYGTKAATIPDELVDDLNWVATAGHQADVLLRRAIDAIDGAGLDVEGHARVGDAASVLIDVAAEVNAGLIVVGNKGMAGVARFLLGSVPSKVAHHAPCDVLIVRTT